MNNNGGQNFELGAYSVQWMESTPERCALCDLRVGRGLVGFKHDDPAGPICDPCMMRLQPRLGTLLLLVNICRELADDFPSDPWDSDRRQAVLMAVARLYHAQESREWPMRALNILSFWEQHGQDLGSIPLESWLDSLRGANDA